MSSEFYIQGHKDGGPGGIALDEVLRCFGKTREDEANGLYHLDYDGANKCSFRVKQTDGLVSSLSIFKPCAHENLLESLFDLLGKGWYVLFAPGGNAPVVTLAGVKAHLPEGMIEALGEPVIVTDAKSILAVLFG